MPTNVRRNTRRIQTLLKHVVRPVEVDEKSARHYTAMKKNIAKFGKPFLHAFKKKWIGKKNFYLTIVPARHESSIGIALFNRNNTVIGIVKLGFAEKTIIVERFYGWGGKPASDRFAMLMGSPWPHAVIGIIEGEAKKAGYTRALIRRAQSLDVFQNPITGYDDSALHDMKVDVTRRELKRLIGITAKQLKYKNISPEFKGKKL